MLYFYYGSDMYSLSKALRKLKAQFPFVEELVYEEGAPGRLREILGSQGLFAGKKLVILRGWVSEIGEIWDIREIGGSADVLFLEAEPPDKRLKFFKWLVKNGQAREFVAPAGAALEKWIGEFVGQYGGKIENEAVRELTARIGSALDLRQYAGELEKLILYCGGKSITAAVVRALVARNFSDDVFAITNAFAEGRSGEAAAVLRRLHAEPVQIVGALAAQIRSLLLVKSLGNGEPRQIAETLGWKEGRVWVNQKLAAKFTMDRLVGMQRDLLAIDRRLKTTQEPPQLLLTLFLNKSKT